MTVFHLFSCLFFPPSLSRPVRVPDSGVFLLGPAVFPTCSHLHRATSAPVSAPQISGNALEVSGGVAARATSRSDVFFIQLPRAWISFIYFFVYFCSNQVLLFPALSFIQSGRLSSLEFLTQELAAQTHVRFQTYRPHCHYPGHHLLLPGESDTRTHRHTSWSAAVRIKAT